MDHPNRYDRNMQALSAEECAVLAGKRVTVVGCGGLGGYVIEILARIGVGHLRVVDGDVFAESNLNRQLLCIEATLGRAKALVAAERIGAVNSEVETEPVVAFLDEANAGELISGSDCVVDCLDGFQARSTLAQACQESGIPLAYGAIAGWFGQVCIVYPGDASFATIYGDASGKSRQTKYGNLPFAACAIASIQAAEAVKVLLNRPGQLRNCLMTIDLIDGSTERIELR